MGKMRRDKLIVTFDEDARKEYLTGFRKRKQERRKVAQDNIKEMERKAKKEARDERRQKEKEMAEFENTLERYQPDAAETAGHGAKRKRDEDGDDEGKHNEEAYSDDFTKQAFGADAVVVSTTLGLPDADEEDDVDALRELAVGAPKPRPLVAGPKLKKPRKAPSKKAQKYKAKHDKSGKESHGKRRKGGPGGSKGS